MCGINGIYGLDDLQLAKQKVLAMNNSLKHRGPDDEGTFVEPHIALGHRRLSIIDLSSAGHQPMASFDNRYRIVYNGELYNYKELKFELQRITAKTGQQAYFFQTSTDTEVIIAAYARWGVDCLNHFNGMFAFAIWDSMNQELFIARDRLGIKPLYYLYTKGVFAFSSEIRSLISTDLVPAAVDENSIVDYLRYQTVHAPNTIIKGIKMLLPGHFIRICNNNVTLRRYWQLNGQSAGQSVRQDYRQVCKDVRYLLKGAVERRLIADVPFGAFLSGGIDSSTIVGLMQEISTERVKTFTITFDESEFSESVYAALVAKKFNTDHHEIRLKPTDFLKQLPEALAAMDHPSGDGPNTFIVSKATKQAGISMALSGLGGDELFGGYAVFKRYSDLKRKNLLKHTPQFMRSVGGTLLSKIKPGIASEKIAEYLKQPYPDFEAFYLLSRQVLLDKQVREVYEYGDGKNQVSAILAEQQLPVEGHGVTSISIAEISTYMQNVLLRDTDQMSMAHALEVRVPFLDYLLTDYVLHLPDHFKAYPKKLLVDAMEDLLPAEVINRPKMGFVLPWAHWIRNELRQFCEHKLKQLGKRKGFRENGIHKLWNAFLKGDPRVNWSRVWILVVLENWLEENDINS